MISITIGGSAFLTRVVVSKSMSVDAILGLDFLESNNCVVDAGNRTLEFSDGRKVDLCKAQGHGRISAVLTETATVPPQSELEVLMEPEYGMEAGVWLLEPAEDGKAPVCVARAVVSPSEGQFPVRLLNPNTSPATIRKGSKIAVLEQVEEHDLMISVVEESNRSSRLTEEKEAQLWKLVEGSEKHLSEAEREELLTMLKAYADVFSSDKQDYGHTTLTQHQIHTGQSPPIRQQMRRTPTSQKEATRQLVQEMLEKDVIQRSCSPWAAPVILVRKKDGSLRFCIDYRRLNEVTTKDAYPLPRVDDTLDTLAGSKWFSTLDLASGYWQVEVHPDDREKTAFCTPEGLFEFKMMPFGLCNAPATFQRLMDLVLSGLKWETCLVYIDDIVVPGKTFTDHLHNLTGVLRRLREANLKVRPSKCHLCLKKVQFLGHIVSEEGVATDPSKTEKVSQWPKPTCQKDVQRFLGLASYYRRFVKNFAQIAKPLHRLTERNAKFKWTTQCEEAFHHLRSVLVTAPVLALPDPTKPFILDTDASDEGIGAVLSQKNEDGVERVVAYASRVLSKPERRYCVTRRELLAVVTFVQHFRPYLLGQHFTVRSDHGSLAWLANFKNPEGQLARWLAKLQEYDFRIVHRGGRKHGNADALSRHPCEQCGRVSHDEQLVAWTGEGSSLQGYTLQEIEQGQREDPDLGWLMKQVEEEKKPSSDELKSRSPCVRRLVELWPQLEVKDGVLWRQREDANGSTSWCLVVPRTLREEVLKELHEGSSGGHLGTEKTILRLQERFYWPNCSDDVKQWCRTCPSCATRKTTAPKTKAPLQSVRVGYPMQMVAVDLMGPFPESEAGNSYILVAVDYFTRWMEAYAVPNQEANTVARKLTEEFFFRYSPPEQLHSDQGKQFESKLVEEICKMLNIKKSRTTPYHPQGDGLAERYNRTLLDMLSTLAYEHPLDWESYLRPACLAYNSSVQPTTGYSPFQLMYGRQARLPVDLMYSSRNFEEMSPEDYATSLKKRLQEVYSRVRERMAVKLERQKEIYDKKVHGKPFQLGDLVWLHSKVVPRGGARKLHHPWTGPFEVKKQLSDATYRIKELKGRKKLIVHFDRLKLCEPNMRLEQIRSPCPANQRSHAQMATPVGTNIEVCDPSEEPEVETVEVDHPPEGQENFHRQYPQRRRQQPDWYGH